MQLQFKLGNTLLFFFIPRTYFSQFYWRNFVKELLSGGGGGKEFRMSLFEKKCDFSNNSKTRLSSNVYRQACILDHFKSQLALLLSRLLCDLDQINIKENNTGKF